MLTEEQVLVLSTVTCRLVVSGVSSRRKKCINEHAYVYSFDWKLQVVMSCVDGGPAARAGIHEGDELVEIDGKPLNKYLAFFF